MARSGSPPVPSSPTDTGGTGATGPVASAVSQLRRDLTKLDLLFMVDGSIGMAEKQARLAKAIPLLLRRFTHPWCMSTPGTEGSSPIGSADGDGNCAEGTLEFQPIRDIHVGVIRRPAAATTTTTWRSSSPPCAPTLGLRIF